MSGPLQSWPVVINIVAPRDGFYGQRAGAPLFLTERGRWTVCSHKARVFDSRQDAIAHIRANLVNRPNLADEDVELLVFLGPRL